jgi:hypothetical protein
MLHKFKWNCRNLCFAQFVYLLHIAGKPRYDLGSDEVEYFGNGKFTYISVMSVTQVQTVVSM